MRTNITSRVACLWLFAAHHALAQVAVEPSASITTPPPLPETTAQAPDDTEIEARNDRGAPVPEPPAPDPYQEAKERVARGEKLFEEGNFDAALAEFRRSYDTMQGHPARYLVLYNIGQCYEKLYLYDSALESYQSYLFEGGESAEDRATVRAKMDLLSTLLGKLELTVTSEDGAPVPEYELWVDGRFLGKDRKSALIPGGNHEVEIRARGFESRAAPLGLAAMSTHELSFKLTRLAKEYSGLKPPLFWATAGTALASAIAGGITGAVALDQRNSIDALMATDNTLALREVTAEDQKQIENLALTADIFFIAAGALGATAVVLGFMTDFNGAEEPKKMAERKKLETKVSFGPASLTLRGTF